MPMSAVPALVSLHVWGTPSGRLPAVLTHVALDRFGVRGYPGLTFAKVLGTGSGQTFAPQDADPHHWALLTCWDAPHAAATFERSRIVRHWDAAATERVRVLMTPVSSIGTWSGRQPFGSPSRPRGASPGPVAALTRARIRWRELPAFWRALPYVTAPLATQPGLRWSLGIGEAPIGFQGTFSIWDDMASMDAFAYRTSGHRRAIDQTRDHGWFREELFARLTVQEVDGEFDGRPLMR